jgi:alginate O-acetyltransferase complex protein AlgI
MVFSSLSFLLGFLPLVVVVHGCLPGTRARNLWLLLVSLGFVGWSDTSALWTMLAVIGVATVGGLAASHVDDRVRRSGTTAAVLLIVLPLLVLKYGAFVLNTAAEVFDASSWVIDAPALPIGISFFTFQAMAYVIDARRGVGSTRAPPQHVALYIALFPQLIAGPIVRFSTLADAMVGPRRARVEEGAARFAIGLAKKVLIADTLAVPVDLVFALPPDELSTSLAWFGALAYALQIYFDFSGYSDMAIGLGRVFGFAFPENFRHPYRARSITAFWRRWHITLSSWFRDYVYIPLGGNRAGRVRTVVNLLVVFVLCGLWHGAAWTFLVWGLLHGAALGVERLGLGERLGRAPPLVAHAWTVAILLTTWVVFRADDLSAAGHVLSAMAGSTGAAADGLGSVATPLTVAALLVGLVAALRPDLDEQGASRRAGPPVLDAARGPALAGLLVLSAVSIIASTHHPFIYYRF